MYALNKAIRTLKAESAHVVVKRASDHHVTGQRYSVSRASRNVIINKMINTPEAIYGGQTLEDANPRSIREGLTRGRNDTLPPCIVERRQMNRCVKGRPEEVTPHGGVAIA